MCNLDTFVSVQSPVFMEIKFSFHKIYHKIRKSHTEEEIIS